MSWNCHEDDDFIIRVGHMRASKVCTKARQLFFEPNEISWRTFVSEGLSAKYLATFNHAIVNRVIQESWAAQRK